MHKYQIRDNYLKSHSVAWLHSWSQTKRINDTVVLQQSSPQSLCWGGQLCLLRGACKTAPCETWANSEPGGKEESEWNKHEGQQCKFSKHGNLLRKSIENLNVFHPGVRILKWQCSCWKKWTVFNVCGTGQAAMGSSSSEEIFLQTWGKFWQSDKFI